MKKLLFIIVIIANLFFLPQKTFAIYQTDEQAIQFPVLLQGTTLPLQSSDAVTAWQGSLPISVSNSSDAVITDETPIHPENHTQEQTIYTDPSSLVLSAQTEQLVNQEVQSPPDAYADYPSVTYSPTYSLQPVETILLQGNATPDTTVTIQSAGQNGSYAVTIPTLDQNASFVLDTLAQTLTNKVISGALNTLSNIPNNALVNSGIKLIAGNGISLSSTTANLGDTISITNTSLGSVTDTLDSVVSRGGTTAQQVILSNAANELVAGELSATGGTINGVTIGNLAPETGVFKSVNGLTIDNNGSNALSIGAGKTVIFGNSVTINGTDGTTLILPSNSDTLVGLTTAQTLTNKTITAGANTISGLTVSNFISNALSQWTNDIGFITSSSADMLTNKTLAAASNTISGLTVSNFSSAALSQWTNDVGFITATGTQTLMNKTINAASNTISNLTNSNLSGTAGISNENLANASITVSSGTGLSGGATVPLGGTLTLTNSGVTSLTGTIDQVNISGSTGGVTLSLPQSIATESSPSFSQLTLSNTSNQLIFGNNGTLSWSPTTTRILTLPDVTDTLIGKTTTDTLTNKTLTAPAINGIITTTGLTLPSFTANGTINGSGSPAISNFGSVNGLSFSANSTGFSIAGGTTSKTLTLNNSLTLAGTDATTMTFPSTSDTLVGLNATQTLVNKTLTAPTFNGTVTTTGLTLPAFTASGTIDQSGSSGSILTGSGGMIINGDASVSAGKSFAVTDADKLTVGGTIIPQTIPILVPLTSSLLSQPIFIADTTYQITGTKCFYSVGALLNGAFQVTVDSGTTAPGSGIAQLTSAINLSSTTDTTYTGTLIATPTTINAGDRITAKITGTLTSLFGSCMIYIKRV